MKRLMSYSLMLLVLLGATVLSEDVILGPEEDPYLIEDSTGTATSPADVRAAQIATALAASQQVDTVIISQLDCSMFPLTFSQA